MNNRNTYLNNKQPKTNSFISGTIERTTYNNHTSMTKQHSLEKPGAQQDKMISKIMEVVGKFQNPTNLQGISREILKTGSSKTFHDVLCIFLRAIDGHFERSEMNVETVINAVQVFGYKGNCNKNIFQPIGAPHTWIHCLAILEWFSELASYAYSFEAGLQERMFEQDQYQLTLNAFTTRSGESIANFIQNEVKHLQTQIGDYSYSVESKRMAIRNEHAAQRELNLVQRELQKERQLSYRTKQQCMQIEGQVKQCQMKIISKQEEATQVLQKQKSIKESLQKLKYEIIHQELPPDQCEKIKLEIRDIKNRVAEISEKNQEEMVGQNTKYSRYLQNFANQTSTLRRLSEKLKTSPLLIESDVKPQLPTLNQFQLNDIIKKTFQNCSVDLQSQSQLQSAFREREFVQYFRKQDEFKSKLETKFMQEEQEMLNKEQQLKLLADKQREYQDGINHFAESKKSKTNKTSAQAKSRNELEKEISKFQLQIHSISAENAAKIKEKNDQKEKVKQTMDELRKTREARDQGEIERSQILKKATIQLSESKQKFLQKLSSYQVSLAQIFNKSHERLNEPN